MVTSAPFSAQIGPFRLGAKRPYLIEIPMIRIVGGPASVPYASNLSWYEPVGSKAPVGSRPVTPKEYRPGRTSRSRASSPIRPPSGLHSSRSSRDSGRTSDVPASVGTEPATKVRSAGAASDGLNELEEIRTAARDGARRGPKRIVHGTRTSLLPSGVSRTAPSAAAVPSSLLATRARTRTRTVRPGPTQNRFGVTSKSRAAAPSRATRTAAVTGRRRTETLRTSTTCSPRQRELSARSNESEL